MKSSFLAPKLSAFVGHALAASLLLAVCSVSSAAEESSTAAPGGQNSSRSSALVIKSGSFDFRGKSTPATMRNLVDAIMRRYTGANIILVGAEEVRIEEVTINWRPLFSPADASPESVRATLGALREASGRRFEVQEFGANDFLVSATSTRASGRSVEVFKLSQITGAPTGFEMNKVLMRLTQERETLKLNYGPEHPQMKQNAADIAALQKQEDASENLARSLLGQIRESVAVTLEDLKATEPMPEFKLHSGTGLMVVIGGEQGLEVTRKIVAALK